MPKSHCSLTPLKQCTCSSMFESSTGLICDSLASSIADIDRRMCPTVMHFHQPEETQQLFACPVSVEAVPNKTWNQKGSLNIATFTKYTRTLCTQTRCSTCRVRPPCRRHKCRVSCRHRCDAQRQKPCELFAACHDELMLRIEDASKNQTARNPECTVLDSV